MKKRLFAIAATILFAACGLSACGKGGDTVRRYPQEGETFSYTDGSVTFDAIKYAFSAAVSEEHFKDYYEFSSPSETAILEDVSYYADKEGIMFTGKCGGDAALCGVYVRYHGFFLADAKDGAFGVCLTEIPVGTYEATAFEVRSDNTLAMGEDYFLFDADHSLSQPPMTLNGFIIKYGSAYDEDGTVNKSTKFLAEYGGQLLGEDGSFALDVTRAEGECGLVFLLGMSRAERWLEGEVPYYYFSADGETARLSLIGTKREVIEEKAFALSEGSHRFLVSFGGGKYVCSIDDTELFTVSSEELGFVGVRADGKGATFKAAEIKAATLEEFKTFAVSRLDALTELTRYTVRNLNDNAKGAVDEGRFAFADDATVSSLLQNGKSAIEGAQDEAAAYSAFSSSFAELEGAVLLRFRTDALASLNELVVGWADLLNTEFDRTEYEELSLACESMAGTIVTDPLAPYDGRWWIPEFYRIRSLLGYAETALENAQTVGGAASVYENYFVDLLKAMCQKNADVYYYYYRNNFASSYSNAPYWWYVCTYTLATAPYLYAGTNQDFANTRPSEFRLTSFLYNPADPAYSRDVGTIVEQYNRWISVDISVENPEGRWS